MDAQYRVQSYNKQRLRRVQTPDTLFFARGYPLMIYAVPAPNMITVRVGSALNGYKRGI